MAISEELVIRFFAALEAGDIDTLREIYAPDAVIWHNDDLIQQAVEDNLKVLQGLHRAVSGLRYDIVRRVPTADGVLQQHVLRGRLPNGAAVELHAAMYLTVVLWVRHPHNALAFVTVPQATLSLSVGTH